MIRLHSILSIVLMLCASASAYCSPDDAASKGLQIAKEVKVRDSGWISAHSDMQMILRTKKGNELSRDMRSKTLEISDDGDKGLIIFDTPLDVKGTVFLNHAHIQGSDDQWIFLPSIKRVKRIASRNKAGPFLGSEFAYEDLTSFEVEKFEFMHLRDEELSEQQTFVLEMKPVDKYSGYSKVHAWIDQEHYRPQKLVFYDKRDNLLKTLTFSGYRQYQGKFWRADKQYMVNHKTGKSTDILLKEIQFDVGLGESDFEENRLTRIR